MTCALESHLIDKLSIWRFSSIGWSGEGCYVKTTDAHKTEIAVWRQISVWLVKIGRYWISIHTIEQYKVKNKKTTNFKFFECNKVAN